MTVVALPDTKPFAGFEWMLALRYLRARRKEGFISVISLFSFLGIMLGVATLIVVMSVFNGFHQELLSKVLGFSGHATVYNATLDPVEGFEKKFEINSKPCQMLSVPCPWLKVRSWSHHSRPPRVPWFVA